jgi:pimeloyl-ACP methyl ester carboxylesterase
MNALQSDLLCIHGYTASWRNWDPVVPGLQEHHRVHVARLAGHADGPRLRAGVAPTAAVLADQLERDLDNAGVHRAHLVGNSLGGWLALELAARGRALSVTALSPALGWEPTGAHLRSLALKLYFGRQLTVRGTPLLPLLFRFPTGRRVGLKIAVAHGNRMSPEAALAFTDDMAECTIWRPLKQWFLTTEHTLGPIDCPVRIAWSEEDALIPLEPYGARFPTLVPHAEMTTLAGVGHVPMYDDPELVIRTVLDLTSSVDGSGQHPRLEVPDGPHPTPAPGLTIHGNR